MIGLLAADIVFIIQSFNAHRLIQRFSNWALIATMISLTLSYICHRLGDNSPLSLLAIHHLMFEMTALFNMITVTVYWGLLHKETMTSPEYRDFPERIIHNYFVHAVPGIFLFVNWIMSDVIIKARHFVLFMPIIIFYAYVNYLESMEKNQVLYSFLDWPNDFWGAIKNLLLITAGLLLIFISLARFTQLIKRPY